MTIDIPDTSRLCKLVTAEIEKATGARRSRSRRTARWVEAPEWIKRGTKGREESD
jgi:hypothetical protein